VSGVAPQAHRYRHIARASPDSTDAFDLAQNIRQVFDSHWL
jgi:hypothetical protein